MMTVREYTEEFYKVNIRAGYTEEKSENTARYINGLKMEIQDELSLLSPSTLEEAYQCALKVEEKLSRKQNSGRGKGKGQAYRGRGQQAGKNKFSTQKEEINTSNQQEQSSREEEEIS
jgi:hypothetical protein